MSVILTPEQRVTMKRAAYGAITLLTMANPGGWSTTK